MEKQELMEKVSTILNDTGAYREIDELFELHDFKVRLDDLYDFIIHFEESIAEAILEKEEELRDQE